MSAPTSSRGVPPNSIRTSLKAPLSATTGKDSLPTAGLGAYDDTAIPPFHNARTLVLCFDGTGDYFDADNSNIIQLFSVLKKDEKSQLVYYQANIGTYTIPEIATPFVAKWKKTVDTAVADSLDARVMGGYEFLMEHYQAGDKICMFGFSRGAYTARALVGMIHKVGLLPAGNHEQVPFAFKMYARVDVTGWEQCIMFKKVFSIDVQIEFVGVWDTVFPVVLAPHTLPFTHSNTAIRYFRRAMPLDEYREKKGTKLGEISLSNHRHPHFHTSHPHDDDDHKVNPEENEPMVTDVREVWFAGCYCDVGGGSVKNGTRNSLARISLRWMIRECFRCNTGIQFYHEYFKDIGLDPNTLFPVVAIRPPPLAPTPARVEAAARAPEPTDGTLVDYVQASPTAASSFKSEEDEELADALSPQHDELELAKPSWWILELLPMRQRKQNRRDYSLGHDLKFNFVRVRRVPAPVTEKWEKILVHRSVKTRMEAEEEGKYKPKAKFQNFDFQWVD